MNEQTTRSISQILRRHGPGSLVYIDECDIIAKVSNVRADPDISVNRRRLHRRFVDKMQRWKDNNGVVFGVPDIDRIEEKDIAPLRPRQVEWEPYGQWYACERSSCGVMHKETDADFDGRCRLCHSSLKQLPYVYYHYCGSFAELEPTPTFACPAPGHGLRYLAFVDTHELPTSYFQCRQPGCNHRRNTFYPPCRLQACRARPGDHKNYQISYWRDQWVYYAQNVDFVNLDDGQAIPFVKSDFGKALVHTAVLGQLPPGHRHMATTLRNAGGDCPNCGFKVTPGWKVCPNCTKPLPQTPTSAVRVPLDDVDDGRVTWAILRDLEESRSVRDAVAALPPGTSNALTRGCEAMVSHGISDVVLVKEFPLTTALIGYTRNRSDNQAWLRPFPRRDDKYVVYTDSIGTEAWMVQLSATAIVEWLRANRLTAADGTLPAANDEEQLKLWLIEKIVGGDETIIGTVGPLLHTFSHVLLYNLAVACGLEPSSLGELVMIEALGVAIYAGDSELGALTAAFDQMLDVVMDGVTDFTTCKFDPGCREDERGACVGCVHLPRGCDRFNDDLSRAYLFGGPVPSALFADACGFLGVAAAL